MGRVALVARAAHVTQELGEPLSGAARATLATHLRTPNRRGTVVRLCTWGRAFRKGLRVRGITIRLHSAQRGAFAIEPLCGAKWDRYSGVGAAGTDLLGAAWRGAFAMRCTSS